MKSVALAGAVSPSWDVRGRRVELALAMLQDAFARAAELQVDVWQFAVELGELRGSGVTHTDLRWLVTQGYVQHGHERPDASAPLRLFQPTTSLSFSDSTCFVLTGKGAEVQATGMSRAEARDMRRPPAGGGTSIPHWDRTRRQLLWRSKLVKHFRVPAPNQELILSAFEEEGWPSRVDDPLPLCREIDARIRLHDAIKRLNCCQIEILLHFGGDGTGRGIRWLPKSR
jgi:hypothetical protein